MAATESPATESPGDDLKRLLAEEQGGGRKGQSGIRSRNGRSRGHEWFAPRYRRGDGRGARSFNQSAAEAGADAGPEICHDRNRMAALPGIKLELGRNTTVIIPLKPRAAQAPLPGEGALAALIYLIEHRDQFKTALASLAELRQEIGPALAEANAVIAAAEARAAELDKREAALIEREAAVELKDQKIRAEVDALLRAAG